MGIHINLNVKLNKVSNDLWNNTFNEVFNFVNKTPLGYRKIFSHNDNTFLVYSKPELLKNDNGYDYISLSSDLERLTHCESFLLYSNKDKYIINDTEADFEYTIWDSKTQRFSYHKYILATAMLIEHKLKGLAYVSGDITEEEVSTAKAILKEKLNIDVDTPERFKGDTESFNQFFELMSMLGARVGDHIVEKDECMRFANHLIDSLIDNIELSDSDFSDEELRDTILNGSNKYSFTWSKDILDVILSTDNKDILLGYAALLSIDCSNLDVYEYVCRFFKDINVYNEFLDILSNKKPSLFYTSR